jgi:aryl-alcohol dehydrogenase-like predicted oxidoreductase
MQKRKLGNQGLEVSCIGLGCMGMSQSYGSPEERIEAESIKVLHRALELEVTFFDTAEVYGPFKNEELLGKGLRGMRERAVIATKFGFDIEGNPPYRTNSHPTKIKAVADASLKRLGIEVIDLFYQHRVDPKIPIEEVAGAVSELVALGKVRYFGLSEAGPATIRRAHKEFPVSALQSEYSLWERGLEENIIPTLKELNIGLVPFSPVGRGFLTGQIKSFEDIPQDDYRRRDPRYQGENFRKNLQLVDVVKRIAATQNATPAQVALAWILHQPNGFVPIPGTKRVKYMEENAGAAKVVLDKAELEELDSLAQNTSGDRYEPQMMATVER